jgi:ABC-type lipoprotein release transport system permease subunit
MVAVSHLRQHRRSTVLLSLLLAVAVAGVLAALAGARRTDRAIGEFVAADRGADGYAAFALPAFGGNAAPDLAPQAAEVRAVKGVKRTGRFTDVIVELQGANVPGRHAVVQGFIGMEPNALHMIGRFRVVAGRDLDESKVDEILIDEELARDARLHVGSHIDLRAFTAKQITESEPSAGEGLRIDADVVGVVRRPTDLRDPQSRQLRQNDYVVHQDVYLTSAFFRAAHGDVAGYNPVVAFDVDRGANLRGILATLTKDSGAYAVDPARFLELNGTFKGVDRNASLHSRGLQLFAAVLAVAGLFLVGQTLGRQIVLEARDDPTLRALGMSRLQLFGAALLRAAPVAIGGAVLGALGAIALSPLTPLPGTVARRAELHPGVFVDVPVLLVGMAVAAVVATFAAALPAARAIRARDTQGRRPSLASRLATRGLRPPAVVGVRFALEPGRGRTAVPVRTAIATAAVAVALVLAAATFTGSLSDSRSRPRRYGVTWDIAAGAMSDPAQAAALAKQVGAIPGVTAFAGLGTTAFDTSFGELPSVMIQRQRGVVTPLITKGRAPGAGEVALGALTMREQGLHVGDDLEINDAIAGRGKFRITGTVVLNVAGVDVSIPPGRGALFDWSMLTRLNPEAAQFIAPQIFLVDVAPGRLAAVEHRLDALFPTSTRAQPVQPLDLANLGDVAGLPVALAAIVGLLGLGTVAHAMLSSVRRRQHELAVLKAIGFVRAESRRTVAWQACTFGVVALLIGIPVGVAAGRVSWSIATHQLGIPDHPSVSAATIASVAAVFLATLLLVALVPAYLASRVRTADLLRAD